MSGPTIQAAESNQTQRLRAPYERIDPPRFRWLKRSLLLSLILLLALGGLRVWWGREAQRRVNAFVAAVRGRGEPVLEEDFKLPPIPDDQNAAIPIKQAIDSFMVISGELEFERDSEMQLPLSQAEMASIAQLLSNHDDQLKLLQSARAMPHFQWAQHFTHPIYQMPRRGGTRNMASMLTWSVLYHHSRGNDAQAIEALQDILMLARVSYRDKPGIFTYYAGYGIDALAIRRINEIGLLLEVSPASSAKPGVASLEQIKELIASLLDDQDVRESFRLCTFGERLAVIEGASNVARDVYGSPFADILEPSAELSAVQQARIYSSGADAANEANWPTAKSKLLPSPNHNGSSLEQLAALPATVSGWGVERPLQMHYKNLAERRIAATLLALRLYALDHNGQLPETLTELVPTYLPSVPIDPMRADGGPIAYKPHRIPPVLYGVGGNAFVELKQITPSPQTEDHHGQADVNEGQKPKEQ